MGPNRKTIVGILVFNSLWEEYLFSQNSVFTEEEYVKASRDGVIKKSIRKFGARQKD